eukprot:3466242-Amphidinium_carterae.1
MCGADAREDSGKAISLVPLVAGTLLSLLHSSYQTHVAEVLTKGLHTQALLHCRWAHHRLRLQHLDATNLS